MIESLVLPSGVVSVRVTGLPSDAIRVSLDIDMSSFYMLFSQVLRADQICREFCREFIVE